MLPLPERLETRLLETDGLMLLDQLTLAGRHGDAYAWREALRELEQDWFEPLLGALRIIGRHGHRLLDPVSGKALLLDAGGAWKFWRRPKDLISALA